MVSDSSSISYEIYLLKSGRWELHTKFTPDEQHECVEEAKRIFAAGRVEGVRVIEDTYDPQTKTSTEETLFCSPRRPPPKKPKPVAKEAKPLKVRRAKAEKRAPATRQNSEIAQGIPKIAAVITASLTVAAMISYVALLVLQQMQELEIALTGTTAKGILIAVFLVTAAALFIPLMRRFGPSLRQKNSSEQEDVPALGTNPPAVAVDAAAVAAELPEPPPLSEDMPLEADEEDDDEQGEDEALGDGEAEDETSEAEETPVAAGAVDADMLKFIRDSLEPLAAAGRQFDAFNRFGLTLFFSGAAEYLASREGMPRDEAQAILSRHVQLLGHTPEMAEGFCSNIDEYLVNPKYFKMYEAGRSAIVQRGQAADSDTGAVAAMDFWNEPAAAGETHDKEFVAVLFTDIVGSTAMTQERGDAGAQLVVHEHNTIVRDALALHGGREIKHTGDGIMATFPQITNAVEGAVAMQEACQRSNAANPGLGLGLCIGVNAGEPIHEGGDIFGTPVQMAARVLSKAEGDEIAVSNIVREMCVGKSYDFAKKGDYELKGFAELVPIYLVEWQASSVITNAAE